MFGTIDYQGVFFFGWGGVDIPYTCRIDIWPTSQPHPFDGCWLIAISDTRVICGPDWDDPSGQ